MYLCIIHAYKLYRSYCYTGLRIVLSLALDSEIFSREQTLAKFRDGTQRRLVPSLSSKRCAAKPKFGRTTPTKASSITRQPDFWSSRRLARFCTGPSSKFAVFFSHFLRKNSVTFLYTISSTSVIFRRKLMKTVRNLIFAGLAENPRRLRDVGGFCRHFQTIAKTFEKKIQKWMEMLGIPIRKNIRYQCNGVRNTGIPVRKISGDPCWRGISSSCCSSWAVSMSPRAPTRWTAWRRRVSRSV